MKRIIHILWCVLIIILISCNSSQNNGSAGQTPTNELLQNKDSVLSGSANTDSTESPEGKEGTTTLNIQDKEKEQTVPKENKESSQENKASASISVKQPASLKEEAKKFCDFFKTLDEPSQFYTVPANQIKEIKGNAGTIISVNPEDLSTLANQPVEKNIEVELKELTKRDQLLKANAQTVCKGKLLVSGGAYYINLKSDGQPLKLKPGRAISVKFPQLTETPMSLFTGYRDSLGQMQWQQRNQVFKPDGLQQAWRDTRNTIVQYDGDILEIDTLPKRKPKQKTEKENQQAKAYEKVYAAMEIQSLGWINCDRFYNIPDKTTLSVKFDSPEHFSFASIYLIFDDINSIVQTHYGATENGVSNPGFENIPIGVKARLVAFSLKADKMLAYSSRLVIQKNETITISLKETNDEDLKELLSKK